MKMLRELKNNGESIWNLVDVPRIRDDPITTTPPQASMAVHGEEGVTACEWPPKVKMCAAFDTVATARTLNKQNP